MPRTVRKRVLIVEPSAHYAKLLAALLTEDRQVAPHVTTSVGTALTRLEHHTFDAVLLDWHVPPDGGLAVCRRIRATGGGPNWLVPVIMMSATPTEGDVARARDAGATEFVAKPLSRKTLAERLSAVWNRPRNFISAGTYFGPDRRRRAADWDGSERRNRQPRRVSIPD